jgi:integrase
MKTLTDVEVQCLFRATEDNELHRPVGAPGNDGLRLGEALGLRWEDIDFEQDRLQVRRALQRQRGQGLVLVEPKTAKSRRTVYFPEGTTDTLREHRWRQLEARLQLGPAWQDADRIFCQADGSALDPSQVSDKLHRALKKAGLPQVRVHDLRHTAATLYLARGENPKVVQELLGHSTISLTLDTSSHVTPAIHAAAAGRMQALFANV